MKNFSRFFLSAIFFINLCFFINGQQETQVEEGKQYEATMEGVLAKVTDQYKSQLKKLWDSFTWKDFKKKFKERYESQIVGTTASIRSGVMLTEKGKIDPIKTKEGSFLNRRTKIALEALNKTIGGQFFESKDEMPRIGCAFSGGGYRAMILTSGYLKALESIGLLDAVLYISTLSGSTWYLGPWTFLQDPAKKKKISAASFNKKIIEKIEKKHFDLLRADMKNFDFEVTDFANYIIWPKILFEEIISSVDVYGAALAHFLLADAGKKRQQLRLSDQIKNIELGNFPWPIYTAVSMHKLEKFIYNWYEFNPEEVRNLELNLSIPSYAFGRKFDKGKSTDFPPGESFGYLMGIFGSAYTVNLKDLIRILFGVQPDSTKTSLISKWYKKSNDWAKSALGTLKDAVGLAAKGKFKEIWNKTKDSLDKVKAALVAEFISFVSDVTIKFSDKTVSIGGKEVKVASARVAPAQVFNPFKGYTGLTQQWLKDRELLTFVDAGIDYNIPLRPLLRPERDLDVIIVGDASGDVPAGTIQLDLALADIKRFYGLNYKKDEQFSGNKVMSVYRAQEDSYPNVDERLKGLVPPVIIYFNFLKDNNLIKGLSADPEMKKVIDTNNLNAFDPVKCVAKEFCGTFNFAYTVDDYKQLSGIAEFNVRANKSSVQEIIEERGEMRIEEPEFGGG